MLKEATLYKIAQDDKVICTLCERRCIIKEGNVGFCKTRKNINKKLYTLIYGYLTAVESRPIEIKPFYHFYPGSSALTYSSVSCNFDCPWCQNYTLSKTTSTINNYFISPKSLISQAIKNKDKGICVSFNEPTLLHEYNLEVFRLAKEHNLYTTYVSNGYFTDEALSQLIDAGIDAIKIDLKGNKKVYKKYCADIKVDKIYKNIRRVKEAGIHLEIVNLIIPTLNDNPQDIKDLVNRILDEVGNQVPLHFTRYYPTYKFNLFPPKTPLSTLISAYEIAKDKGILYVYLGNIQDEKFESTYCWNCKTLLIRRYAGSFIEFVNLDIKEKRCKRCNKRIPIRG